MRGWGVIDWDGADGLVTLFLAAFVAATLLPANSEVVLLAVLLAHPERAFQAIAVATLGNTLGGLTMYGLGRLFPRGEARHPRAIAAVRRYGAWALLLAWAPVVGDALCAIAGWLRVPLAAAALAMAAGKLARYLVVAQLTTLF